MPNKDDQRPWLLRAHKEVRDALKDCDELLERTRVMLARSEQDNDPPEPQEGPP